MLCRVIKSFIDNKLLSLLINIKNKDDLIGKLNNFDYHLETMMNNYLCDDSLLVYNYIKDSLIDSNIYNEYSSILDNYINKILKRG